MGPGSSPATDPACLTGFGIDVSGITPFAAVENPQHHKPLAVVGVAKNIGGI